MPSWTLCSRGQEQWQPNVQAPFRVFNVGFSNSDPVNANINCIQTTPMPDTDDINFRANSGHFHVPGGPVAFVGRYIRVQHT